MPEALEAVGALVRVLLAATLQEAAAMAEPAEESGTSLRE